MAYDLGSVIAHIKADLSGFTAGMDEAKAQTKSLGQSFTDVSSKIREFAEQAALVVGVQTVAFAGLAKEAIGVAANFEQTQTSFGTLLGSEQKAADLMKEIMSFEQHTPFDIGTLTDAAKQMLAFGVNAKDVVPKLKELTDMSQGQASKLTELVSIYGQVNSIQQLNGREVLRLSSIGIPIYQALEDHFKKMGGAAMDASGNITDLATKTVENAKMSATARENLITKVKEENAQLVIDEEKTAKTKVAKDQLAQTIQNLKDHIAENTQKLGEHQVALGGVGGQATITGAQIKDMIANGQVSSKVFNQVLQEMTSKGGLFFNENIRQMSTFNGIMSSTQSQLQYAILNIMGIDIGAANEIRKGGLFDTLRSMAANLLDWLHRLQPVFEQIGKNNTFKLAIEGFVIALASLIVILPAIIIAFNPVILVVLAIEAAIIGLYVAWNTNFLGIRNITETIGKYIVGFWNTTLMPAITLLKNWWHDNWQYIADFFMGVWFIIKGIFEVFAAVAIAWIRGLLDILTGNWKDLWKTMQDVLTLGWSGIQHILEGALIMVTNAIGLIVNAIKQPFQDAWNFVSGLMNKIKDALDFTKRHSPSVLDIVQNGVGLVNQALQGIQFQPNISTSQIANNILSPLSNSGAIASTGGIQINIDMAGAMISDKNGANRIAEQIGNNLINRLKENVRF